MDKNRDRPEARPATERPLGQDDIRRMREDVLADTGPMEGAREQKARQPNPGPKSKNV